MKLIKKHGNKIALLLSVALLATAVIGGTLAYVVTRTPSLLNTFIADHSGDILIKKEVEHPFGDTYSIPDNIVFNFNVSLGTGYANKEVTLITADQPNGATVPTGANGVIDLSIKPNQAVIIKDVAVGSEVTVTEQLSAGSGFSVKNGEAEQKLTIEKGNNTLEYVNKYAPASAPVNLEVYGTKVIEGREWIDGDSFTLILEKYSDGEWEKLGEAVTKYKAETTTVDGVEVISPAEDMDEFSFTELFVDGNGQSIFTQAGVYSFRIREEEGNIPGLAYDTTDYAFDVLVGDADMDGALEIQDVTPADSNLNNLDITGTTDDGFDVEATVTNRYAPEGSAQVTIEIEKQVVSNSGEEKSPAGFTFQLYDKAGSIVETASSSTTGDAEITLEYGPEDAGKSFDYILKEKDDARLGWEYDITEYPITVKVVDNNDGTISAYIGETEDDDDDDDDDDQPAGNDLQSTAPDGEQQSGEQQSEEQEEQQPDGEQQDDVQLQSNDEETTSATEPEIGNADNNEGSEGGEQEGGGNGDEVIINTSVENAPQSATVYLTGKRFTGVPRSAMKLTSGNEDDNIPEIDASGTSAPDPQSESDPGGAAQADLSAGQGNGKTSFKAVFTNTYNPVPAQGENITGKKTLTGRDLNEGEFEFALYTVEEDGDLDDELDTVSNDAAGEFVFDMSTEFYGKVGAYKYAVVEVEGDLGGVTYDEARFDIIVTVTDNNGNLEAKTVIKDKLGAEAEIEFVNEYAAAKAAVTLTAKKELTGADLTAGRFSFLLYEADESMNRRGDALEKVSNAADGAITFKELEFTEAGTYCYVVNEDASANEAGITYDSTAYGIMITVTDNGEGQLVAETVIVNLKGGPVEAMVFHNKYTKPAVTPTPAVPVTPTPRPVQPSDDVEIPIYPEESDVPDSGDDNPIGLYAAIMLISAGAIAGLVIAGKTGRRSGKRKKRARAR
ncbi:MAG: hypothetical protein IJN83_09120 [Clostridia bacterium]|nr:hypothetical protein [Clostridia bacterium]